MKKSEYPIAVIDEQEGQLDELRDAFQHAGEHCNTIQYNPMYSEEPYTGIELLFLDVNLNPAGGQGDKAIYGILDNAIKSYIAEDNGPYVLIFWTTRPELVDGFKEYLTRDKTSTVYNHRPIYVDTLPKDVFQVHPKETLESILNKPIVKLVFSLHEYMRKAASNAFYDLIGCIPLPEHWGDNDSYVTALKDVFTKIAVASVGKDNAVSTPDKAIYEVVGKEVLYHLVKNSNDEWKKFLAIDSNIAENAKTTKNQQWQYNLNTNLHIDATNLSIVDRGTVITANKWEFEKLLGKDWLEWCNEEFSFTQSPDDKGKYFPIAIEISASCDYAQGNNRLYRYVLGVCRMSDEKPSVNIESGKNAPFKKNRSKFHILPTFFVRERFYKIVLSYNYIVGVHSSDVRNYEALFRLRDELTTLITSCTAEYGSRIGVIDVNES